MNNTNDRDEPLDELTMSRRRPGGFDGPTFMYGPGGASHIFHHPAEVPEGWVDNPNKLPPERATSAKAGAVTDTESATRIQLLENANIRLQGDLSEMQGKLDAAEQRATVAEARLAQIGQSGNEGGDTATKVDVFVLPAFEDIELDAIKAELTKRNIRFNASWAKKRLYDLLADAVKEA